MKHTVEAYLDIETTGLMYGSSEITVVGIYLVREDSDMIDVRIWTLVLLVQGIPYLAAVLVALIGSQPKLPARLVGAMK